MFRATSRVLGGLTKFKFEGPRWSRTRQRNRVKRFHQEQSVLACLRDGKAREDDFLAGNAASRGFLHVQLIRSTIGRPPGQRQLIKVLSLNKINAVVERPNTHASRAVVNQVRHMVLCQLKDESGHAQGKAAPKARGFEVLSPDQVD